MTPAPARITENMAASRGLEDVWRARRATLRSGTAARQRAGRMSDGYFLYVVLYDRLRNNILVLYFCWLAIWIFKGQQLLVGGCHVE